MEASKIEVKFFSSIQKLLNRLLNSYEKKNDMTNEITGFGGFILFFLIILSELLFKGVIRFSRFVKKLNHQWKMVEKDQYFQCSAK